MLTVVFTFLSVIAFALSCVAFWQGLIALRDIRRVERELLRGQSVEPRA